MVNIKCVQPHDRDAPAGNPQCERENASNGGITCALESVPRSLQLITFGTKCARAYYPRRPNCRLQKLQMFDGGHYSSDGEDDYENGNGEIPEQDLAAENVIDEDSPDEIAALDAAVNRGIRNGVRQFLRILNVRARRENRGMDVDMRGLGSSEEESADENDPASEASDGEPNRNFDVHECSKHQYLFKPARASEEVDMGATMWLQPGKEHTVPVISLDLVVLPGQMVPMQIHNTVSRAIVQRAIDSRSYLGLLPVIIGEVNMNKDRYGILLQVNKYVSDGLTMKVHAIGRQRFRVISIENEASSTSMARVEVLDDLTRIPLPQAVCPSKTWTWPEKRKLALCSAISSVPHFVADNVNLDNQCKRLGNWLEMWFSNEKIRDALELGPVSFSYWAARNIPMPLSTKYEHLVEDETNLRIISLLNLVDKMTDLVCRGCGLLICNVRDIVNMNSEGTSSHFVNSAGYIHEMVTVAVAQNFVPRDQPCAKFSWFPGYKWQIIECRFCMDHLGWEFTSRRFNPPKFYGITRKAVVPRKASGEQEEHV